MRIAELRQKRPHPIELVRRLAATRSRRSCRASTPAARSNVGMRVHPSTTASLKSSSACGRTGTTTSSASPTAFGLPGQVDDQRAVANAGQRSRKHRGRHDRDRCRANRLGDARDLVVEDRGGRLRRAVARAQPGAAAGHISRPSASPRARSVPPAARRDRRARIASRTIAYAVAQASPSSPECTRRRVPGGRPIREHDQRNLKHGDQSPALAAALFEQAAPIRSSMPLSSALHMS